MTTLSADTPRSYELGANNDIGVIAGDIIYEGAAVGVVPSTGYARPLATGDVFSGFARERADNSAAGAAAGDIDVKVLRCGQVELTVSGVESTDVGQPVYASDDATFTMVPGATTTSYVFVGFVKRCTTAGTATVVFDADVYRDPYGSAPREVLSGAKTLDIQDNGKVFFVDTTAVITLPATATPVDCLIVNAGAYGDVQISVSPQAADKIQGPDLPGTNDKDHINTLATAQRGDRLRLHNSGDANGAIVTEQVGVWATEA